MVREHGTSILLTKQVVASQRAVEVSQKTL